MIDLQPFIEQGQKELAVYLLAINQFVEKENNSPGRKKSPLRAKSPDVYLRNMLAVAILNRLHRPLFLQTQRRLIVLPACLKAYHPWKCQSRKEGKASVCAKCHPDCHVFSSMERFADSRTTIVLEPGNLKKYLKATKEQPGTVGIVGVACVLTLLSGFDQTIKQGLPTQGIFLNYSSCKHHWADPPYNTNYSLNRLAGVLGKPEAAEKPNIKGETYLLGEPFGSPSDFYTRLDNLAEQFEKEYLPQVYATTDSSDLFAISRTVMQILTPDLITRNAA